MPKDPLDSILDLLERTDPLRKVEKRLEERDPLTDLTRHVERGANLIDRADRDLQRIDRILRESGRRRK